MSEAFQRNVRRALEFLQNLEALPAVQDRLQAYPPAVQHLGIVVLREALSIELERRKELDKRARMSEARKKQWADPEVRARMSEARKKALADPEVRARMSEARKKQWADFRKWKKSQS